MREPTCQERRGQQEAVEEPHDHLEIHGNAELRSPDSRSIATIDPRTGPRAPCERTGRAAYSDRVSAEKLSVRALMRLRAAEGGKCDSQQAEGVHRGAIEQGVLLPRSPNHRGFTLSHILTTNTRSQSVTASHSWSQRMFVCGAPWCRRRAAQRQVSRLTASVLPVQPV